MKSLLLLLAMLGMLTGCVRRTTAITLYPDKAVIGKGWKISCIYINSKTKTIYPIPGCEFGELPVLEGLQP